MALILKINMFFFYIILLWFSLGMVTFQAHALEKINQRGERLFKKCIHCHTYKKGQNHRIGPNLYGMFGRKAGDVNNFDFSPAWKNSNFLWNERTLDSYLEAPHKMIPGNRMPFDGLARPEDRKALIIYMKQIISP